MKELLLIAPFLIPFYPFSQFENIERNAPWQLDEIHGQSKINKSQVIAVLFLITSLLFLDKRRNGIP
tara:strand:- start:500 stop:700 length:201 start_codon:yes stop_codon:yes gene_type:complete